MTTKGTAASLIMNPFLVALQTATPSGRTAYITITGANGGGQLVGFGVGQLPALIGIFQAYPLIWRANAELLSSEHIFP